MGKTTPPKSGLPGMHPLSLLLFGAGAVIIALGAYNYLTGGRAGTPVGIGLAAIFMGLYLSRSVKARRESGR
jgi:hypothetical protein